MIALLATIALFAYFGLVGYAITLVTVNRRDEVHVLLAPTVGAAAIVVITMTLNYLGAPVQSFGMLLAAVLLLASVTVIWRRKAFALPRSLVPIGIVLAGALVLTGRPMLEFGFDWVSYANDDMSLYVSDARRIFEHGYLWAPSAQSFTQNRDATEMAYLFYVVMNTRSGVEDLLAFVMAFLRSDGYRAYMPLMLALHLTLISAATALTYLRPGNGRAPLAACVLLSASALTTLGTEYQLLGQLLGLPLLVACLVFLCSPPTPGSGRALFAGTCALCGIVVAAEAAVYPEIMTVLGAGVVAFFVVAGRKRTVGVRRLSMWLGGVAACAVVLLNAHISTFANTMYTTVRFGTAAGVRGHSPSHFPYFLIPSGLPNLFGIVPLPVGAPEPWLSIAIVAGGFLLAIVLLATASLTRRQEVAGFGSLAILAAAIPLIVNRNDFGLFKLAMYAQPFFIPTMVMWWAYRSNGVGRAGSAFSFTTVAGGRFWAPIAAVAVLNVVTQSFYVERSRAERPGVLAELPYGSSSHVVRYLEAEKSAFGDAVLTEAFNRGGARLQNYFVNPSAIIYLGMDSYAPTTGERKPEHDLHSFLLPERDYAATTFDILTNRGRFFSNIQFEFSPGRPAGIIGNVRLDGRAQAHLQRRDARVIESLRETVVNRSTAVPSSDLYRLAAPGRSINRLVYVSSDVGGETYTGGRIGLYPLEPDVFYPDQAFEALGRYLVFRVAGVSPRPRLAISLTNTLKTDGNNALPPVAVVGGRRMTLPIVGRGAARVFSGIVSPQSLAGIDFLGLDMGIDEKPVRERPRSNLMRLYGNEVRADQRNMTVFARDISLVDDARYRDMAAPAFVRRFPADLANQNLEFSGIYEDGWTSEDSRFVLQSNGGSTVMVRGVVPTVNDPTFHTTLCIAIDGKQVGCTPLDTGQFTFAAQAVAAKRGKHEVRLHFDRYQRLGAGDGRPVAMLAEFIGFGPEPAN